MGGPHKSHCESCQAVGRDDSYEKFLFELLEQEEIAILPSDRPSRS